LDYNQNHLLPDKKQDCRQRCHQYSLQIQCCKDLPQCAVSTEMRLAALNGIITLNFLIFAASISPIVFITHLYDDGLPIVFRQPLVNYILSVNNPGRASPCCHPVFVLSGEHFSI